ncbi:hypothetical protein ACFSKX_16440 [Microbulbifer halophilus]|uniref:Uncharacterized protein n=1 Tax=Microbulbifer halophilus TaxID=453963 RepID=A0ABW5EEX7_9GAMM
MNLAFLFCYYAEVNISKLTFAGMSFSNFGNASAIYYFLWVIWAYFLYRFFVFFIEDERDTFVKIWQREFNSRGSKKIFKILSNEESDLNQGCGYDYYLAKKNNWSLNFQVYVSDGNDPPRVENKSRQFKRSEIFSSEIASFVYFSLLTPVLTNYLLPVLLSLFVIIVCGFGQWDGALLQVFT